jgi:phosphinothricin acetyltransferase
MAARLPILIRPCFEQDLQSVQFIYAHHVLHGVGTFETDPPDLAEMRNRWAKVAARGWPFLVACGDADPTRVHGFAYAAQFRERAAYAHTFEDSVYVAPHAMGRGVGGRLLAALLNELSALNVRQVIAVIGDSQNVASIGVHASLQFRHVGVLQDVGFKFGRWLDVVLMQRPLPPPEQLLPQGDEVAILR